jgi:hypothetical protein
MCGRFYLFSTGAAVADLFDLAGPVEVAPRPVHYPRRRVACQLKFLGRRSASQQMNYFSNTSRGSGATIMRTASTGSICPVTAS